MKMGPKKRPAEDESDGLNHRARRKRYSGSVRSATTMDNNYGQRSAFGDFACPTTVPTGDSDLECEDDTEALAYLKSVRVQASALPHVMVASKAGPQPPPQAISQSADEQQDEDEDVADRGIYEDGRGDFRGYYEDGAYVAYPPDYFDDDDDDDDDDEEYEEEEDVQEEMDYENEENKYEEGEEGNEGEEFPDLEYYDEDSPESSEGRPHNSNSDEIREAYFTSIINQYLGLRQILQKEPPKELLSSLPWSNPIEVGGFGPRSGTFPQWSGRLRGTDPLPVQIAGMHKDAVFRLLRILLGGKFLRKQQVLRERTSRWIWALLARLPERGELDYQEIGWIRELGKRAVLLMVSLAEVEILQEHYEVGDSSFGSQDEGEFDVGEGVDESSPEECCDFEYIDTDSNDPEAHKRKFDQSQGGKTSETSSSIAKNGDTMNSDTKPTTNGDKIDKVDNEVNRTEPAVQSEKAEDLSDVEMQIESDSEDGEVSDTPQQQETEADIEAAKIRLLQQHCIEVDNAPSEQNPTEPPTMTLEEKAFAALDAEEEEKNQAKAHRAKVNELATLNMILTVAGEFYGQRDLLEFRDPFGGFQIE
ncbi:uncharacterized protein F4822DRAFT_389311 [Hypoxylon trugodes]|uniref:uncharacterized protein n=1 Tax=Hypoxylon trugodes TaxID=326681 RepID=UPI00219494B8|nr:uncharacterized protein F4822DRAFT_389311 [Hypoxylon trugodes]KAI1392003.1 hypothetical protein F4822DRAFT_389311 [Hypoxylon trugodes]